MHDKPILVVEDNPDHLELTVLTLEEQGSDTAIVTARDGAEALDYLFGQGVHAGRDTQKQPAFVLLDMKLPYFFIARENGRLDLNQKAAIYFHDPLVVLLKPVYVIEHGFRYSLFGRVFAQG